MKRLSAFIFAFLLSSCALWEDYHFLTRTSFTNFDKGVKAFDMANYQSSLQYLAQPAEQGNVDAQYMVGMIHMYGLAGTKNSYMAQKWLTMAANAGHRPAQEQLAFFYRDELTPLYNPINAYYWFNELIEERPQYLEKLQNLEWTLRSRGLLSTARSMPKPKASHYEGMDYNDLFPLR